MLVLGLRRYEISCIYVSPPPPQSLFLDTVYIFFIKDLSFKPITAPLVDQNGSALAVPKHTFAVNKYYYYYTIEVAQKLF
jgi:hypothetical protein